jgi:hypothetical protein
MPVFHTISIGTSTFTQPAGAVACRANFDNSYLFTVPHYYKVGDHRQEFQRRDQHLSEISDTFDGNSQFPKKPCCYFAGIETGWYSKVNWNIVVAVFVSVDLSIDE